MRLLLAMLSIVLNAAASMPAIISLIILAGRRGHGRLCLWSANRLLVLTFWLALVAIFWFGLSYFTEISHFHAPLAQKLAPLLHPPGLPWSSSLMSWLIGIILIALALASLNKLAPDMQSDSYSARIIRLPLIFCLLATFCFYATFLLINWPFTGLPEGLGWDRAVMAIFRNANRNFFLALCPAGAIGLTWLIFFANEISQAQIFLSVRWFAFWACAGCLPTLLINWGTLMGLGMGSHATSATWPQATGLICLTLALAAWAVAIWRPRWWRFLAIFGLLLLLLKTGLPFIMPAIL